MKETEDNKTPELVKARNFVGRYAYKAYDMRSKTLFCAVGIDCTNLNT